MDAKIFSDTNFLIYAFIQTLLLIATVYALKGSIKILISWNFDSTHSSQYELEKRSYLIMTVIIFLSAIKIFLFPFFAYLVDNLSNIIPGAMCAAGVVEDFEFSNWLLSIKLLILLLSGVWLVINKFDLHAKTYPYMKFKNFLFLIIAVFILFEFTTEIYYFSSLNTKNPVSCCSDIYGVNATMGQIPLGLNTNMLLILFYATYLLTLFSALQKHSTLAFVANIFFLFIAYYCVVHFFGTYIYQQPTHKCPFCMLQREYYYVGYFIWASLFLGVFSAIAGFFVKQITKKEDKNLFISTMIFNTFFVGLNSYFVVSYYIINGVFL